MRSIRVAFFVGLLFGGCTKSVNRCESNDDCSDVAYPFCDALGVYPASGGEKGVCTIRPPDCPAEQCGCTPGSTCVGGVLTTCAADGMSTSDTMCSLGCGTPSDHCATFVPSFGVSSVLASADAVGGVSITAGSTISTDTGVILDRDGNSIAMPSSLIPQLDGPDIRVFYAKTQSIDDVRVLGTKSVSFVASGPMVVHGILDISARTASAGPGALEAGDSIGIYRADGPLVNEGGGGNGTDGASGLSGASSVAGRAYAGALLVGGGRGADAAHGGGGGGGAIQLVSLDSVSITGAIRASGGGGKGGADGAGGAGGTIVIEAPTVGISGVIAANGGAGSVCGADAPDGPPDGSPAVAQACDVTATGVHHIYGGDGGTGTALPTPGAGFTTPTLSAPRVGGGAAGRVIVRDGDGMFSVPTGVVVSAVLTVGMLQIQ